MDSKENQNKEYKNLVKKIKRLVKEVFDSETTIDWDKTPMKWIGFFNIEDDRYRIKIETDAQKIDDFNMYAIKFSYWNGEEWDMAVTNKSKPFSIFGVLRKAIWEFFDEIKPSIFLFIGDEQRDSLYNKLSVELAKRKDYIYLDDLKKFVYILIGRDVSRETIDKIKKQVISIK